MKINQIINEGKLRGNWNLVTVNELTGRQLAALKQNATRVGDQEVLGIIAQIEQERADHKRAKAAAVRPKTEKPVQVELTRAMAIIDNAIGNAFPDSDPLDYIARDLSKFGVKDYNIGDLLDKAVRGTKSGRSYHEYVRNVWQQHLDDNPDEFGTNNPW